jgi:hypothetical protein
MYVVSLIWATRMQSYMLVLGPTHKEHLGHGSGGAPGFNELCRFEFVVILSPQVMYDFLRYYSDGLYDS